MLCLLQTVQGIFDSFVGTGTKKMNGCEHVCIPTVVATYAVLVAHPLIYLQRTFANPPTRTIRWWQLDQAKLANQNDALIS
jgi:hypothetical protein